MRFHSCCPAAHVGHMIPSLTLLNFAEIHWKLDPSLETVLAFGRLALSVVDEDNGDETVLDMGMIAFVHSALSLFVQLVVLI